MIISKENEPVTTHRELEFSTFLDELGVVYRRNHIFCFNCREYFPFARRFPGPSQCKMCARTFCKGEYCIPDFLIVDPEGGKIDAVVMINEKIHYKNRQHMLKVKWQVKSFLDLDIPVIILREEDITKENAQFVKRIIEHNDRYTPYLKGKKFKEDACFYV